MVGAKVGAMVGPEVGAVVLGALGAEVGAEVWSCSLHLSRHSLLQALRFFLLHFFHLFFSFLVRPLQSALQYLEKGLSHCEPSPRPSMMVGASFWSFSSRGVFAPPPAAAVLESLERTSASFGSS